MPSTFQYKHETDQIAMYVYRLRVFQYELQFTLLVPLIAVKFSARIVVIHLTALLELHDCSIRVFNLDNPPTYNNHGAKKPTLQQSHQPILSFLAYTEFNKNRFF